MVRLALVVQSSSRGAFQREVPVRVPRTVDRAPSQPPVVSLRRRRHAKTLTSQPSWFHLGWMRRDRP